MWLQSISDSNDPDVEVFEAVTHICLFQPKDDRYVNYNNDQDQEKLNQSKQSPAKKAQSDVDDDNGMQALQRDSFLSLRDPCD